jgi:small subunit ribosomal protein S6
MKRYEIVLVVLSDLSKDEIDSLIARYGSIIATQKGIVVKSEKWGTRKLAYRINKQPRGSYILIDFAGDTACVVELERNLKFDDAVLRFLTIKKADKADLQEIEKEIANAKKEEKPAEVKAEAAPAEKGEGIESGDASPGGDATPGEAAAAAAEKGGEG